MDIQKKDGSNNKNDNKELLLSVAEKSVDHLKCSLRILSGSVVTFITLSLIIMGMLVFQNKKEIERTLSEVNSAKEDIRYYRNEAHATSQKINDEGTLVIKTIQGKGNDVIIQIEKKSQEEIEKLKQQILEQREITNLWIQVISDDSFENKLKYLGRLEKLEPYNWLIYDYEGSIYKFFAEKRTNIGAEDIIYIKGNLLKAKESFEKAYSLFKGSSILQIVNICAKLDQEEECVKWLKRGIDDSTLPKYQDADDSGSEVFKYKYGAKKEWFRDIEEKWRKMNQ